MKILKVIVFVLFLNLGLSLFASQGSSWVRTENPFIREFMRLIEAERLFLQDPHGRTGLGIPIQEAVEFRRQNLRDLYEQLRDSDREQVLLFQQESQRFLEEQETREEKSDLFRNGSYTQDLLRLINFNFGAPANRDILVAELPSDLNPALELVALTDEGDSDEGVEGERELEEDDDRDVDVDESTDGDTGVMPLENQIIVEEIASEEVLRPLEEVQNELDRVYPFPELADHRPEPFFPGMDYQRLVHRLLDASEAPDSSTWGFAAGAWDTLFVSGEGKNNRKKLEILTGNNNGRTFGFMGRESPYQEKYGSYLYGILESLQNQGVLAAYAGLTKICLQKDLDCCFRNASRERGVALDRVSLSGEARASQVSLRRASNHRVLSQFRRAERIRRARFNQIAIQTALKNLLSYSYDIEEMRPERVSRCGKREHTMKRRNLRWLMKKVNKNNCVHAETLKEILIAYKENGLSAAYVLLDFSGTYGNSYSNLPCQSRVRESSVQISWNDSMLASSLKGERIQDWDF